jgi:hypothetical protein
MLEDFIDKETDICLSLAIHCMDKITAKLDSMLISCTIHQMSISRYQTYHSRHTKVILRKVVVDIKLDLVADY